MSSSTLPIYESKTAPNQWWLKDANGMIDAGKVCMNAWYPNVEFVGTTDKKEYTRIFKANRQKWLFSAELVFKLKAPCCLKGNSKCDCKAMEDGIDHFAFQCKPSEMLQATIRELIHKGSNQVPTNVLSSLSKILCYGTIEDSVITHVKRRAGKAMLVFYY